MEQSSGGGIVGIIILLVQLAVVILMVASAWKVFTKAGKPGWAVIVPIYSAVVLLQIVNKPIWWIILMFIPIVNFVIAIILCIALAQSFGKGTGFAIGLLLLGFVFVPILGFGDAQYQGAGGEAAAA